MANPDPGMHNTAKIAQDLAVSRLQKTAQKRQAYMTDLEGVMDIARGKVLNRWTRQDLKLQWCRILIQAISAGGDLLKVTEFEDMEERLIKLENEVKKNC